MAMIPRTPVLNYFEELASMSDNLLRREYKKVTGQSYWHRNMGSIKYSIIQRKFGDTGTDEVYNHPSGLCADDLLKHLS